MADEADIAFELQSQEIQMARALNSRSTQAKTLPATGRCHFCDAPVGEGQRFCDHDCSSDWENEQRLKALAHGPSAGHASAFSGYARL